LSDLEWPFHTSRAVSAVAEPFDRSFKRSDCCMWV